MALATSIPHYHLHTSAPNQSMLIKPHKIRKLSQIPIKTPPPLKQICKFGNLKDAFQSFTDHNSLLFCPDGAYAPLLELCATKKALSQGKQIHAHMIKSSSVCGSVFLSTKLVLMYGKCGFLLDAEEVFDKMSHRTTFTWNAMIGAYVSTGKPLAALEMYLQMRISGVPVDFVTFPSVLKACAALKNLNYGAEIHGLVIKCAYDSKAFVVNSLVSMYAKCDDLNGARQLFNRIVQKDDVVLWNSIISAYSCSGQSIEALNHFGEMIKAGIHTNSYTYVAVLQACVDSSFTKLAMEIHAAIMKSSSHLDVYVKNALIAMYLRCGKMTAAARIFDELDEKDAVSWNAMLTGFIQNSLYGEALEIFHDLLDSGRKPDQVSVLSIAAASGRLGNLMNGMEVHAYAIKIGFDSHMQVGNTLIDMYAKCCCVNYMGHVFEGMPNKDFISWTTVIAGYAQNNYHVKALELFRRVQGEKMDYDAMMIGSILQACSGLKCVFHVTEIHGYLMKRGLFDLVLQNTMVDVYGECGNIYYATRMFDSIQHKDVVSWTSIISSYVHNGLANEALKLFYLMKDTGIEPDSVALVSILSAAANLSALNKGKEIHGFIVRKGFILEGSVASSLVDMYAHCGTLESAYKVFNHVRNKGLILWTTMMNAEGLHGRGKAAIDMFNRMKNEKIAPDHITILALLYACSHSGLIDEGKQILESMKRDYQLEPWPEHYACLIDLLGRANRLEEAYQFVRSMQIQPTAEVWCALLGACRVHSNEELGQTAAEKLLELNPYNPGNYVLVSNVFAASGRWKDVEQVRMKMKASGLKKSPGCSWIELGNEVHSFIARDKSHPESDEIY
ncbi:PPR domain-containing protein/PPR_2 domain-containing protein [Cephalotus follicularis]|uniref:PPR domain-containing protein/PPR_2 domain-containing protein n=1 Tax=Cephalotus follicularis TaxID=3775 RepID=A0A1Q3CWA5_CEPFO|nr:PPR domain-containing protein/PPR_2 domain-containing protein [Cephalotus follicularis]